MTGTNCDLFTQKSCRSYLNHLVHLKSLTLISPTRFGELLHLRLITCIKVGAFGLIYLHDAQCKQLKKLSIYLICIFIVQ
jgi:hypothetical protein